MKYQQYLKRSLLNRRNNNMATVAIIGGVAVGLAVGALFATKKGKITQQKVNDLFNKITGRNKSKANQKLMNVITDVRTHVKQNAEGLLNPKQQANAPTDIKLENATSNWKNAKEETIFPNEPLRVD